MRNIAKLPKYVEKFGLSYPKFKISRSKLSSVDKIFIVPTTIETVFRFSEFLLLLF